MGCPEPVRARVPQWGLSTSTPASASSLSQPPIREPPKTSSATPTSPCTKPRPRGTTGTLHSELGHRMQSIGNRTRIHNIGTGRASSVIADRGSTERRSTTATAQSSLHSLSHNWFAVPNNAGTRPTSVASPVGCRNGAAEVPATTNVKRAGQSPVLKRAIHVRPTPRPFRHG